MSHDFWYLSAPRNESAHSKWPHEYEIPIIQVSVYPGVGELPPRASYRNDIPITKMSLSLPIFRGVTWFLGFWSSWGWWSSRREPHTGMKHPSLKCPCHVISLEVSHDFWDFGAPRLWELPLGAPHGNERPMHGSGFQTVCLTCGWNTSYSYCHTDISWSNLST